MRTGGDFARGCNSIQNLVNFFYHASFGTVRSEVRILSPRPVIRRKWATAAGGLSRLCRYLCHSGLDLVLAISLSPRALSDSGLAACR
jgi:hypothetical protein